jgi:hypothetical protein
VFCQLVVNGFSKYLTIYTVLQHYTTEETCLSTFQSPIDPSTILGGFPGNNFTEASAFVITYPVNNKVETTGQENGKAVAWERAYVNLVKVSNFSQFISLYLC